MQPGDISLEEAVNRLKTFAGEGRHDGVLTYYEAEGFLFGVCASPDMIMPSEWAPMIYGEPDEAFETEEEFISIFSALTRLYNGINECILDRRAPDACTAAFTLPAVSNLDPKAPVSQWARGLLTCHDWLFDTWEGAIADCELTGEKLHHELATSLMMLSFFSSKKLAKEFWEEEGKALGTFEKMAGEVVKSFQTAMYSYAAIGRSMHDALFNVE